MYKIQHRKLKTGQHESLKIDDKQNKEKAKKKHSRAPGVTSACLVGSVVVTFSMFCAMLCFSLVFYFFSFVFFVFVLCLVCLILAVSLDYRFLIDPSVFANV